MIFTNDKGFTMAELLAVVLIVSLMATFSIGYYAKAQEQARFSEVLNKANAAAEKLNQKYLEDSLQGRSVAEYEPKVSVCSKNYCVDVTTDFATNVPRNQVICRGKSNKGKAFCESMGYVNCDINKKCTR